MRISPSAAGVTAVLILLGLAPLRASDRFIVPAPEPATPAPSSSSSSSSSSNDSGSNSGSSGGSGSSGSSGYSGDGGYSSSGSDRFIVPVPHRTPSHGGGSGGPIYGGGGHVGPGYYYDDYWGGCYYLSGRYYYWGGYYYSPSISRFSRFDGDADFSNRPYPRRRAPDPKRLPVFFPPEAPPLGSSLPPPPPRQPYLVAPQELAIHVADPFYPALSSRLAKRNLTAALRRRLDAYVAEKTRLQEELREHLKSAASVPPAIRLRDLEAFAKVQTPPIAALEAEADRLRTDLLRVGLVGTLWGSGDWNEHREWRLGRPASIPREQTLGSEFQIVRAAVFYQDGFSPAQRRLLREVAMELQVEAFRPRDASPDETELSFEFFSPETARIRLPSTPPPTLAARIDAYLKDKTALKSELREVVYHQDIASPSERVRVIRQLASAQATRIQALEVLAEEIRRALADAGASLGELSMLSPALTQRVTALQPAWQALRDDLAGRLDDINKTYGFAAVTYRTEVDHANQRIKLSARVSESSRTAAIQRRVEDTVATFNRESAPRVNELKAEGAALRQEIATLATAHPTLLAGKSLDAWWIEAVSAAGRDTTPVYHDYRLAVLEPGLSPEQRRLLFDAALQELRLPLPGGEFQP